MPRSNIPGAAYIAQALEKPRKSGDGWVACCPAHEDANPSLSLRDGDGGKVLVHCHAGCDQRAVIEALKSKGLWESERKLSFSERFQCAYDYHDERGNVLYQVVRLHSPKDFRQRYPDPCSRDGWTWRKFPRQVLYHLPEVLAAHIVFVVEGEKDVERLHEYGFVATTNAGGAKAPWLPQYTAALAGKEVIIVPDNDEAGWEHARTVNRALLGSAARITLLKLPLDIKDITDWFAAGHSECELIGRIEGCNASR